MNHTQPSALPILFLGEFLEKFSFWGLQSLLVLYLSQSLKLPGNQAYAVFGAFTALAFVLSIAGGILADKLFGFRRALIIGTILVIVGNVLLALKGFGYASAGLAIIALGAALFTTSNANLLGTCYETNDLRRNRGFIIFYMATNMGGMLGPIIYGYTTMRYGLHYCFILSSIVLSFWISLLVIFNKTLKNKGLPPSTTKFKTSSWRMTIFSYLLLLLIVCLILLLMRYYQYIGILLSFVGFGVLLAVIYVCLNSAAELRNIILIILSMIIFCLVFFSIEFQVNSSLILFADQHVDRKLFNWLIPANTFASFEPFFVIILAPLFAFNWRLFGKNEPSPFLKISVGLVLESTSFIVFSFASHLAAVNVQKISIIWLLIGNSLLGAAEICIMPTVISAITKLAPIRLKGTLMGALYLSLAFSGYLASVIAKLTTHGVSEGIFLASEYSRVYSNVAVGGLLAALIGAMFWFYTKEWFDVLNNTK